MISNFDGFLDDIQRNFSLEQVGFTTLTTPLTISFYKKWLEQKYNGEMLYLKNHYEQKNNPQLIDKKLQSAITITQSYFPLPQKSEVNLPARIALYAQNDDYHFWLKEKLTKIIEQLKETYPEEVFLPYVDSGPVLERDLAYKSGLGWFGKNSCLIHPQKGSLFFIAEILCSINPDDLKIPLNIEPLPDFCGTCTKCMDICPTNAIVEPKVIKADQCISYLTIESKKTPPLELREKISDWFFGCDLCQTVCPWNQKVFRQKGLTPPNTQKMETSDESSGELVLFFREILNSSGKQLQKKFFGSPLFRAAGFGLKRNAMIVIANKKMYELKSDVEKYKDDEKLSELAVWTLQCLQNN